MSFYDDASLVFLPSGGAGKDTKAYSIKPTDGSGDFTFSRGSNLTATRVDSNGLIEKGRENLAENSVWDGVSTDTKPTGWSNQFVSGTGTFDVTATEGQIRFQTLDASSRAFIYSPTITTNGIVVASVYVDEVTTAIPLSNLLIRSANATDLFAYEDGVEINYSDNVQANKRYSVVFNKTGSTTFRFGVGTSSGVLGDVVLSKPQIEIGLVATEWITSPVGSKGLAGILEDSPRFDYSGGASCPSLLLEPSRTNEIGYSEYFDSWTKQGNIIVNTNEFNSPEGVQNATELDSQDSSNYQAILRYLNLSAGTYTFSFFLKKTTGSLSHYAGAVMDSVYKYIVIDTTNGTYSQTAGTNYNDFVDIESWDSNWWRVVITNTISANSSCRFGLYSAISVNGTSISPLAIGTNVFYGAQVEQGSYPTSYIPNHSGGSVTREADYSESSTSLSIGDSEFCAYYEMDAKAIPRESSATFFRIEFGSNSHYIGLKGSSNSVNNRYTLPTLGNYSETINNITESSGVVKFLINYSNGTGDLFVNGTKYAGVISGPTTGNTINNIELRGSGYSHDSKQILLFPSALSDAECITLTTL